MSLTIRILNDYISNPQSGTIDIKRITDVVVKHYDLKKADIKSKIRSKKIVRARQIIMYLSKELTSESLDKIRNAKTFIEVLEEYKKL